MISGITIVSAIRMSQVRHSNHLQFPRDLRRGVLTGNENYVCGGVMHVGDHDIHCKATVPDMDRRL